METNDILKFTRQSEDLHANTFETYKKQIIFQGNTLIAKIDPI